MEGRWELSGVKLDLRNDGRDEEERSKEKCVYKVAT